MYKLITFKASYLNIYVKSYLIITEHYNVFIDSGLHSNAEKLIPYLQNGKKNVLLMTHGHWDHIGSNDTIHQNGGVIYANSQDMRFYTDFDWHWQLGFGQFERDIEVPPERKEVFWKEIGKPAPVDRPINKGEELTFDDIRLQVIGLSGHSNGSVGYFDAKKSILFTGDALMGTGFFGGMAQYCNYAAYIASMQKIIELSPETVYTGHTDALPNCAGVQLAKRGADFAGSIKEKVQEYLESARGDIELKDAVQRICAGAGTKVGGGACVTVLNHLCDFGKKDPRIERLVKYHICGT